MCVNLRLTIMKKIFCELLLPVYLTFIHAVGVNWMKSRYNAKNRQVWHSTSPDLESEPTSYQIYCPCRFILHAKKTGFVVEHDFIMATYLADRVIVFEGNPSVSSTANR